jgi:hypothetical protein
MTIQQEDVAACDRRLSRLLAASGAETDREIERLILVEVRPIVNAILTRYVRRATLLEDDVEELTGAIDLILLKTLRALRNGCHETIHDLGKYAAALTYNAIGALLRQRYPERANLKNRVRYALTHDTRLAMWNADRGPAGGLRQWKAEAEALDEVPPETSVGRAAAGESHAEALVEIFTGVRQPVLVEALVDFLQGAWDVPSVARELPLSRDSAAGAPDAAARLEDLDFTRALWSEIRELRPLQRKALLLNLRYDGDLDILPVLILLGVARLAEIAQVLELSEAELMAVWKELPLEDARIAEMLGVTRQQVINLRKSARERLARRMSR